jgi:hypothetical protein
MSPTLTALRDVVQEDGGHRGLASDPSANLLTTCAGDLAAACRQFVETPNARVGIVTGFYIPSAAPAAAETDGPLGALFLARALAPLGARVVLLGEDWLLSALGGMDCQATLVPLPTNPESGWTATLAQATGPLTHLISLERVGPSHTLESLRAQGAAESHLAEYATLAIPKHRDRCHNMRGVDITGWHAPAHLLFEASPWSPRPVTIGIGDGGNEIGMGKIPWDIIRRNIPRGGLIACRVPTDYLIVAGVSNWGAYALAAGICFLSGEIPKGLFDPTVEEGILRRLVAQGPLVDGATGRQEATVDGLMWIRHAQILERLEHIVRRGERA